MNERINFTKQTISSLVPPEQGKKSYTYDNKIPGLGIMVNYTGVKSFFVYKKISGQPRRIVIGRFPDLSVEIARKEAQKVLGKLATGINPIAEKREQKAAAITLAEAFEDYLKTRKNLKDSTIYDYRRIMNEVFPDWQNKCLQAINKEMVAKRHADFGKRSQARANNAMRVLRAVFNFAAGQYEDSKGKSLFPENPVKRLSHTRAWYRVDRRQTVIKPTMLPKWFDAVMKLNEDRHNSKAATIRDYLLLILFTGLRREEAAKLTWHNIDFSERTLTVTETKNHRPHVLPLSDFIYDILKNRVSKLDSKFIFPGEGKCGYIVEPRKQMNKVVEQSGVKFTLHDLRRTFITIAESLDIPAYALKHLLNHKMASDVTAGYIVIDVERLRKPMQSVSDYILYLFKQELIRRLMVLLIFHAKV